MYFTTIKQRKKKEGRGLGDGIQWRSLGVNIRVASGVTYELPQVTALQPSLEPKPRPSATHRDEDLTPLRMHGDYTAGFGRTHLREVFLAKMLLHTP